MSVYSRTLCMSTLASILLHASTFGLAASAPLSLSNATISSSSDDDIRVRPRQLQPLAQPDNDGWLHFDSFGLMLPMDGHQDDSDESLAACQDGTVECQQHNESPPSQPDFIQGHSAGARRGLQLISGSRDLVRRNGTFGLGEDGQPIYSVIPTSDQDADDGEEDDDDDADADEEEEGDNSDGESPEISSDAEDTGDLVKRSSSTIDLRHSSSTLAKRASSYFSNLFKRKTKSNKKKTSRSSSRKTNRNKAKGKGKGKGRGRKSGSNKSKKGKGGNALEKLGSDLIMKGATLLTTITWYTGVDLLNPYCDRESKWTPTDDSMIIAVTQKWSARPACGEFMEIQTTDKGKKQRSIVARVVDLCGGCIPEVPHADLSKAAFSKLYDLDVGRVKGLKMRRVSGPRGKWSDKLYGPRNL